MGIKSQSIPEANHDFGGDSQIELIQRLKVLLS
jgi:hypothetical protein